MSRTSESNCPEVGGTRDHPQSVSRRQALGGFGLALATAPFAAPAFAQARGRRAEGPAHRHVQNKRVVVDFLERMASADRAAALRQYCHPDCRFEVFHPFNTLVGLEAAEAAFWGPLKTSFPNHEHRIAFTTAVGVLTLHPLAMSALLMPWAEQAHNGMMHPALRSCAPPAKRTLTACWRLRLRVEAV